MATGTVALQKRVGFFVFLAMMACAARGQDAKKITVSFLPPPLEHATYSLGIYDAKTGKLVRRLQEFAKESAFVAGLNGLITSWDGKDDAGQPAAPGRYAARGYAVGAVKAAGIGIAGNDWAAEEESVRIKHVKALTLVAADDGLAVLATMADDQPALLRFSGGGKLVWRKPVSGLPADAKPWLLARDDSLAVMPDKASENGGSVRSVANYTLENGETNQLIVAVESISRRVPLPEMPGAMLRSAPPPPEFAPTINAPNLSLRSGLDLPTSVPSKEARPAGRMRMVDREAAAGKDHTLWSAGGLAGLVQTAPDGTVLRALEPTAGDLKPVSVSPSTTEDRLYLLEEKPGWQRVRGLSWKETTQENGQPVSTWQTFFERSIRAPDPALGLDAPATPAEISLVENPLAPGKPSKARLAASFDDKGSYLATADGLRLRQISQRANLQSARLAKGKTPNSLAFYQYDGAATDEFSIAGARNLMAFDAGEIELTADGEKPHPERAAEPPDL